MLLFIRERVGFAAFEISFKLKLFAQFPKLPTDGPVRRGALCQGLAHLCLLSAPVARREFSSGTIRRFDA